MGFQRNHILFAGLALLGLGLSPSSHGSSYGSFYNDNYDGQRFSLVSRYMSYEPLRTPDPSKSNSSLGNAVELELSLRIQSVYQMIFAGFKTNDQTAEGYGAGFAFDLPGFFWLASENFHPRARKQRPLNTTISGTILQTVSGLTTSPTSALSTDMSISVDLFLFNKTLYLNGKVSLLNFQGMGFLSSGAGLGIEF